MLNVLCRLVSVFLLVFLHSRKKLETFFQNELRYDQTNKVSVRPVKTQIILGIRPVWSESSLTAWRKLGALAIQWAHSEVSDQTGRMPRLIWVFGGHTLILLVLSCRGSNNNVTCYAFSSATIIVQPWRLGIWATAWQNQRNDMSVQRRLRSAWASRVFAVRMKTHWVLSYTLSALRRHWSESSLSAWGSMKKHWAQADLSPRWAHRSFCWFSRVVAYLYLVLLK